MHSYIHYIPIVKIFFLIDIYCVTESSLKLAQYVFALQLYTLKLPKNITINI
jgi:hypothetical protein